MKFAARDRVMVVAPHPDDETLSAGGLLQRVVAAGASARIVFVTDGEDNPWPQRVVERRLRIDAAGRVRWGVRRRCEALGALATLGIPPACATFLGLPDQGLTRLLTSAPRHVSTRFVAEIRAWQPNLLVMPSLRDLHPDHGATAVSMMLALATLRPEDRPIALTYVVHPLNGARSAGDIRLHLSPNERGRKRAAIDHHATQLVFHARSYRRTCTRESFGLASTPDDDAAAAVHAAVDDFAVRVRIATRPLRLRSSALLVIGLSARGHFAARLHLRLRAGSIAAVPTAGSDAALDRARLTVGRGELVLSFPPPQLPALTRLFVKLVTSPSFIDVDGWHDVPLNTSAPSAYADVPTEVQPEFSLDWPLAARM